MNEVFQASINALRDPNSETWCQRATGALWQLADEIGGEEDWNKFWKWMPENASALEIFKRARAELKKLANEAKLARMRQEVNHG